MHVRALRLLTLLEKREKKIRLVGGLWTSFAGGLRCLPWALHLCC
jgi:hypothetical protein